MKKTVVWIIVIAVHVVVLGGIWLASVAYEHFEKDANTPPPSSIDGPPNIVDADNPLTPVDGVIPPPIQSPPASDNNKASGALGGGEMDMTSIDPNATRTHVVARGDSLWKVAKKYGLTHKKLAKANNLPDNASLKIGQKLIIPNK